MVYVLFAVLLVLAAMGITRSPEVRPLPVPRPRYRPQRLALPSCCTSPVRRGAHRRLPGFHGVRRLRGAGIGVPVRQPAPAVARARWARRLRLVRVGCAHPGLHDDVAAAAPARAWAFPSWSWAWPWSCPPRGCSHPACCCSSVGAALSGVGSGAIYRSTLTVVITSAPADERAGALALFFVVGYVGLSRAGRRAPGSP